MGRFARPRAAGRVWRANARDGTRASLGAVHPGMERHIGSEMPGLTKLEIALLPKRRNVSRSNRPCAAPEILFADRGHGLYARCEHLI